MISEFSENVRNVSSLPDKPALTSEELKLLFDKAGIDIKNYINNVLVQEINNELANKVTVVSGRRLITTDEINKINGIEEGADNLVNHISYGTTEPNSNTVGEYYFQYFD